MRSKAPLMLIELLVMLLVLALAAALCLQGFAWAEEKSREYALRDHTLRQMQNMAEAVQASTGDLQAAARVAGGQVDGNVWRYTGRDGIEIVLTLQETQLATLGSALAEATVGTQELQLTISWQEVAP